MLHGENRGLTVAASIIATIGVFAVLYFARALFIPITLACVLALVLAPIVRILRKAGMPRALASGGVVISATTLVAFVIAQISAPAAAWFARLPEAIIRLRYTFSEIVGALENVKDFTEDIASLSPGKEGGNIVMQGPDLTQVFLSNTGQLLTMIVIAAVLLFFLLANGDLFLLKTVHTLSRFSDKKRMVQIGRDLQVEVSRYLLTITAINLGLGAVTAGIMAAFSLPDALLWGVLAASFNFIPYAGAILTTGAILLASLLAFPAPVDAVYPTLAFLAITVLEGNLITPALVGRRFTINPVVVFVSLLFWGWLWGIAGLLLAVPLLVVFKILCDHTGRLHVIGEFLSSVPPKTETTSSSPSSST
ncbi:MAG: AI-2E family transporter [Kiloniellaceae bacterium]